MTQKSHSMPTEDNRLSTGLILGRLDAIGPFLLLGGMGHEWAMHHAPVVGRQSGLFVFGLDGGSGGPPYLWHGFILPLSTCTDDSLRLALTRCIEDFRTAAQTTGVASKDALKNGHQRLARVSKVFRFDPRNSPSNFIYIKSSGQRYCDFNDKVFTALRQAFPMVTELSDGLDAPVAVTAMAPLPWQTSGEALAWYESRFPTGRGGGAFYSLALIFDGAVGMGQKLPSIGTQRMQMFPGLRLDCPVSASLETTTVKVNLTLDFAGWAFLDITFGDDTVRVYCSDAFPPFWNMLRWLKQVAAGTLPTVFRIDEEGNLTDFLALPAPGPTQTLFALTDHYTIDIHGAAIVERCELVDAFRRALYRFFMEGFDPEQWDESGKHDSKDLPCAFLSDPIFDALRIENSDTVWKQAHQP